MPQKRSLISQFWQELKRRRVVHVITVYASATFVLIELVNNLTEPLNLPARLSTIVIVILAVGFPLAIILAWIYDLTPEGIEKTKAEEETAGDEQTKVPNTWRIAISRHFSEELVEAIDVIYKEQGYHAADKEIVKQFELLAREKYVPHHILAARHYAVGAYTKALDDLEKGYELHNPFMPYIVAGQNGYPDLYDSTRFTAIVKNMNLPLPN